MKSRPTQHSLTLITAAAAFPPRAPRGQGLCGTHRGTRPCFNRGPIRFLSEGGRGLASQDGTRADTADAEGLGEAARRERGPQGRPQGKDRAPGAMVPDPCAEFWLLLLTPTCKYTCGNMQIFLICSLWESSALGYVAIQGWEGLAQSPLTGGDGPGEDDKENPGAPRVL